MARADFVLDDNLEVAVVAVVVADKLQVVVFQVGHFVKVEVD